MPDKFSIFQDALMRVLAEIDLTLSAHQVQQLERHYAMLDRWNARVNLTTVSEPAQAARRHFGESLFLSKQIPAEWKSVVDVGSGGGFPGYPVAVALPDRAVTLVESRSKKATFLKEVSRETTNVRVSAHRFEDLGSKFDAAMLRAVNVTEVLPLLRESIAEGIIALGDQGTGSALNRAGLDVDVLPLPWEPSRLVVIARFAPQTPGQDISSSQG